MKNKIEYFCEELSRNQIKPEIREIIEKNEKWKEYLKNHTFTLKPIDPLLKEKDKCDLAKVISLSEVDDCLTTGTAGKIVEERVKEEVLMHRLKQVFEGCEPSEIPDDPYEEEWKEIRKKLDEPACFV